MQWDEDFELGVPELDTQHRSIYLLIQRVCEANAAANRVGVRDAIVEFEQVTRAHFEYEERLMAQHDYPDLARHTTDHARLMLEVQSYQDNPVFNTQQLRRVLFNWLTSHIMMTDRPLALHILRLRASGG